MKIDKIINAASDLSRALKDQGLPPAVIRIPIASWGDFVYELTRLKYWVASTDRDIGQRPFKVNLGFATFERAD